MLTIIRESWKQTLTVVCVFIAWTVSTFVCHESGKIFLRLSEKTLQGEESDNPYPSQEFQRFGLAAILTTVQCVTCLLVISPDPGTKRIFQSRVMLLLFTSHALATLATNYSMAYIEAASTLAIKLTEPVTMAIGHHVISRTSIPLQTAISVPVIISGAVIFTEMNVQHNFKNIAGILLAFASNIILTARNLTLKYVQDDARTHATMTLKPYSHIAVLVLAQSGLVGLAAYLQTIDTVTKNVWKLMALCLTSGVFHVIYSYISTNIVLRVMNVVSHSIANIFKRFLVVLLLYMGGTRQITVVNFFGLCISLCGLLIYTGGKKRLGDQLVGQDINDDRVRSKTGRRKTYLVVGFLALATVAVIGSRGRIPILNMSQPGNDIIAGNINRESLAWGEYQILSTDFSDLIKEETDPAMRQFLTRRLVEIPEDTDQRAKMLTSNKQVIEETQRILVHLLQELLGKVKHVMLVEIETYKNKGDSAIAVGEIMLLRMLNVTVVFYCRTYNCILRETLNEARDVNKQYAKDELVILFQGGGNLVGYQDVDAVREKYILLFPDRKIILFSQSIWLHPDQPTQLEYPIRVYSNRSNLVMLLRDRQSFEIARANFKGVKLILAPDLAFCIGMVPRQLPPIYDIVWLKREDNETSNYVLPSFPSNISVDVRDWLDWSSNIGQTDMENAFLITSEAFQFLQRGRVVITDRLHGHILSILMNIPHVLVDNPPYLKLSSFDKSWTASLQNTRLVSNSSFALVAAMGLLKTYHNSLPSVGPRDMYAGSHGSVGKTRD